MEENTTQPVVHDELELTSSPKTNDTALTEVNGNVMPDGQKDAVVKPHKQVNWGGDTKDAASDDENQDPNAGDEAEGGTVVAVKKKKRKSKSKKKGLVRPSNGSSDADENV